MIQLEQVQAKVSKSIKRSAPVLTDLSLSCGAISTQELFASENVPPFVTTAVDGFAVRALDISKASAESPIQLTSDGTQAAGSDDFKASSNSVLKVMTGAIVPDEYDSVVMVENVIIDNSVISFSNPIPKGSYIRSIGSNIIKDQQVLDKNHILTPARIGVLASLGIEQVSVYKKPVVGVMSSGAELAESNGELARGKIRDTNRIMLITTLKKLGFETIDLGIVNDNEKEVTDFIFESVEKCDVIVSTGGVSMGDFDFIKSSMLALDGFEWSQIAIKPGKPFLFGLINSVPFFGLPGNPVSALVSFELLVRPALMKMMGYKNDPKQKCYGRSAGEIAEHQDGKTHYLRAKVDFCDQNIVEIIDGQHSHQLLGLAEANCLAVVPDGISYKKGEVLELIML